MRKLALAIVVASLALIFLSITAGPALYARNIVCDPTYDHFTFTIPPALQSAPSVSLGNEIVRYTPPAPTVNVAPVRSFASC